MTYCKVARQSDLWSGEMTGVEVSGQHLLLVNLNDQLYAYPDVCPHQKSRLSEGELSREGILRCPRHHWEFDARTGAGINPRDACLPPLPLQLQGDDILVDIDPGTPGEAAQAPRSSLP